LALAFWPHPDIEIVYPRFPLAVGRDPCACVLRKVVTRPRNAGERPERAYASAYAPAKAAEPGRFGLLARVGRQIAAPPRLSGVELDRSFAVNESDFVERQLQRRDRFPV